MSTKRCLCAVVLAMFWVMSSTSAWALDWTIQTVDSDGWVGEYTSLALDSSGNPHISYSGGDDLKYAAFNGSTWTTQTVDSNGEVGWDTSLALDSNGNPSISYWDHTNYDLKYAAFNGSAWTTQSPKSVQ